MATLTITFDTGAGTLQTVKTLSASDLTKLQNAFTSLLQAQGNSSPSINDVFNYWVLRWSVDTIAAVKQQQQTAASAAVTAITIT